MPEAKWEAILDRKFATCQSASMDPLQIIGSLLAILVLSGLAAWMKLGGIAKLATQEEAQRAADETVDGFVATRCALDANGDGALVEDADGRILLLKPHGNQFAGRLLDTRAAASLAGTRLTIDSGERRYGSVILVLDEGAYWEEAINRLRDRANA